MSLMQIIVLVVIIILTVLWFKMKKNARGAEQTDMAMLENESLPTESSEPAVSSEVSSDTAQKENQPQ